MSHEHGHEGCGCGCDGGPFIPEAEARRWREAPDSQMVCACAGVDKAAVLAAISAGAHTGPLVKVMTGAGRELDCAQRRECMADLETLVALYAAPVC